MKFLKLVSIAAVGAGTCATVNASAFIPMPDSENCNSSTSPCLMITNTSSNNGSAALYVSAQGGGAITGTSSGTATNSIGVDGSGFYGVYGSAVSPGQLAGVLGSGSNSGYGVIAEGGTGILASGVTLGVEASATNGNAIYAFSNNSDAIVGVAGNCVGCSGMYGIGNSAGSYAFFGKGDLKLAAGGGGSGNAYKPTGTTWIVPSDARLKKDVTDFAPGVAELERVRTVRFKYNGLGGTQDSGKEYVGVIAQELEKVFPTMVTTRKGKLRPTDKEEVDIKQLDASDFTFVLINAVKELSKQNKEILQQNKELIQVTRALGEQSKRMAGIAEIVCLAHPGDKACGRDVVVAKR